jgi:hypothetical protein
MFRKVDLVVPPFKNAPRQILRTRITRRLGLNAHGQGTDQHQHGQEETHLPPDNSSAIAA